MARRAREERTAIILLAAAAVVLSVLSLLLIGGERRREGLLLEFEAERTAADLMESYRVGGLETATGAGVLGFGLYGAGGEAIARVGTAPPSLPPEAPPPGGRVRHDPARRTLSLVRPIGPSAVRPMMGMQGHRPGFGPGGGPGPGQGGGPGGPGGTPPGPGLRSGGPALLFLEISTDAYWRAEHRFRAVSFVAPAAIILMAGLAGYFYWKNAGYRRRMADQEQLARLGEVARTLAHEIKNPLSAIKLQTGILRRSSASVSAEGRREIELIDAEVARLALLSDRIGTFLRDPRGDPAPVEAAPFVQELLSRFGDQVRCAPDPAAAGARIAFDPERLRSILENLVTNAVESGTVEPPEVQVKSSAGHVEIAVLDRGTGIAPEDSERVFDPFFTRKTKGSGVGLAIARRFAEAAGAELSLEARPGGGTAARLRAPRVTA
jgi:two-component system, NtrC family, sensor histidine kinase HydH